MRKGNEESYLSYIKRITNACADKTISYEEWGNLLLGDENTYSSENLRKSFYVISKLLNKLDEDVCSDSNEVLQELEELKASIKKERYKLQTVNVERNRIDRQSARVELFYEQIADCIKKLVPPTLEYVHIRNTKKKYIQTLSDIHAGADFVSCNNEYSPKILKDRFEILKGQTIDFIKDKGLKELTIVGLSDYIQGCLRMNDLRINDSTVVKSVVEISKLISTYLNDLSAYVEVTYADCLYGNHSQQRYLGSQANAMMNEDLGYVIGNYIKDAVSLNKRITVILPKEEDTFVEVPNIFDFNIIIGHGHQLNDITNALKNISMQRRKFYDYLIIGHLHNDRNICSGESYAIDTEVLIAPSICGSDPYSDSLFKGTKSASAIYGFDEIFGHTETYKIILN